MMTREEIIEIEQYCSEHEVGKKARLAELGIPFWNFYKARRKYQREDERNAADVSAGQFIPLPASRPGLAMRPSKRTGKKTTQKRRQEESYPIIRKFEGWMDFVSNLFTPKSRMGRALVYTYALLPRLGRYVLETDITSTTAEWRRRFVRWP